MLNNRHVRGFTLTELMIGLAVLAMLLTLAAPEFAKFLHNSRLRSTAASFLAGVQLARAEAVRRNTAVEILLTDDDANGANAGTTSLSLTGRTWVVRAIENGSFTLVDSKLGAEGGDIQGSAPAVQVNGGQYSEIIFNGLGGANTGILGSPTTYIPLSSAATFSFTNPTGGTCAPSGPMRCLNIVVSPGGRIRMCDPAVTATGDTRAC